MTKSTKGMRGNVAAALAAASFGSASAALTPMQDLSALSLEELSNVQVTSVSGRAESLQEAAASIYVITADDIRRSAATTLPEALRLAPNLQVAQLNASQWSISARGFNNAIGNKLLVLVDGRTIYSALFSGVFWDANDVVLEDIDRIEVISGPGGTLWGANAVNGVINVVTRSAHATRGAMAAVMRSGRGGYEVARYGRPIGENGNIRVYALANDRSDTYRTNGLSRQDSGEKHQAGFRADWDLAHGGQFTLQGDTYRGGRDPASNLAPKLSGQNLIARWSGRTANGGPFTLQAYYDHMHRDDVNAFRDDAQTFDVQFTHEPVLPQGHQLLWGGGLRRTRDTDLASPVVVFIPGQRNLNWANVFAQYDFALARNTQLTVGAKAERNVYSGWEFLPSVRLSMRHSQSSMSWLALSRAVRAPARLDKDFFSPGAAPYVIGGGPNFQPEIANVFEIGHRGYSGKGISYSVTAFQQRYSRLRSGTTAPPLPALLVNQIEGYVNGLEAWGTWQATPRWRLSAGVLELREHLHSTRGTPDPTGVANLGNDPRHQWSLRSSTDLGSRTELDVIVRRVGALPSPVVAAYTAVDARVAVKVSPSLVLSVAAQNLFDPRHIEFNPVAAASQVPRRIFVKAEWRL